MTLRCLMSAVAVLAGLLPAIAAHGAGNAGSPELVRGLARAGAPQLALRRIDILQPAAAAPASAAAAWTEWERLRLQLLAETAAHERLLERVASMPAGIEATVAADLHFLAAQSAMALGRGAAARDQAGRALWAMALDGARQRELRLLVIRSLVHDRHGDDAYRSMLRFQQDYRPLDSATATLFVDGLLDLGKIREAIDWLGLLDERGPAKLRLRLRAGLVTPADGMALARAAIGRSEDPAWWRVLLEAAGLQPAPLPRLEALEQLLDISDAGQADARGLWQAYAGYAREAANAHRLLAGDEQSWFEFAQSRREAEPVLARAYLAFLAREASSGTLRQSAQSQLATALAAARLPRAALRLFGVWPEDPAVLPAEARQLLGGMAADRQNHALALRYWLGLPAPGGMPPAVWDLRIAALALRAGRNDVAAGIAQRLAAGTAAIPREQLAEWMALAGQFADHGLQDAARPLFERVLPYAGPEEAAVARSGIAMVPGTDKPPQAEPYLLAAMKSADPGSASGLRLVAGFSLIRAGLREDARAQFEWVLKNGREPAQIAVARRELGF